MFQEPQTKEAIDALVGLDINQIGREELKAVGLDFDPIARKIKEVVDSLERISKENDKLRISRKAESYIVGVANNLKDNVIPEILNFTVKDNPNSTTQHQAITDNVNNIESQFIENAGQLLTEIKLNNLTPGEINSEINSIKESKKEIEKILKSLNEEKSSAEELIRKASGISATEASSNVFKKQADEHSDSADRWFIAAIASFVILIILFFGIHSDWFETFFDLKKLSVGDNFKLINSIVLKVIVLSVGYFILSQCIKNYKVNRHLYILNKHKHNSLLVYPKMLTAGEDPETRGTILSQASKSIFEEMPTGYLQFDDDPRPINPTAIINKIIDNKG